MKTFVYTIDLKPQHEQIEQYKEYHKAVWDEVKESLHDIGILSNTIYLFGTRLVNIFETVDDFDPATTFEHYCEGRPKVKKWNELMAKFQQPLPEAKEGDWWSQMEKIFEL